MPLNKVKQGSQMYDWITHTWNTIKGKCYHDCIYCYMKQWGELKPVRFDEKELETNLGHNNFIFLGSSCDMFAKDIPHDWIVETLSKCLKYENKYLLQTKNPYRLTHEVIIPINHRKNFKICTTLETNRYLPDIMKLSPNPTSRAISMQNISCYGHENYITVEPIIDFDLGEFIELIKLCNPKQVNIGADSKGHKLPEPPKEKIIELIKELEKFTKVKQKLNLKRLLK
jgi:DNA repair photolyase